MPTRTKRQFLMLSHTFEEPGPNVCGWLMSEKLDGLRMFYDGGISRGLPVREVPFANVERDHRFVNQDYLATGLWSRNAKVIRAPEWFLDSLPPISLDGEVYGGRGNWEVTSSITKQIEPNTSDWKKIRFMVFESPPMDVVFQPGLVETDIYTKDFSGVLDWVTERAKAIGMTMAPPNRPYENVYNWLKRQDIENDFVRLLEQTPLPYSAKEAQTIINQRMEEVIALGGEGLMLRNHQSTWTPERTKDLLKVKKWYDAEAIVIGYAWGKRTSKGSRHLGRMGALIVRWEGKTFELSGFTDAERQIVFPSGADASGLGVANPGGVAGDGLVNPKFPIGTKVTFRYRELSAASIPKNANYLRTIQIDL